MEHLNGQHPHGERHQRGRAETEEELAGTHPDRALGLQSQEGRGVHEAETDQRQPTEQRVGREPGEGPADAVAVGVQRQARSGQSQGSTEPEGDQERSPAQGPVHPPPPPVAVDLAAVLDGHRPENQPDQDEHEGDVQGREQGGVPVGEGGEEPGGCGDQPHLVAVPHRADGIEHLPALALIAGTGEHEHPHAQVEAVQEDEPGPQHRDGDEPESGKQFHVRGRSVVVGLSRRRPARHRADRSCPRDGRGHLRGGRARAWPRRPRRARSARATSSPPPAGPRRSARG